MSLLGARKNFCINEELLELSKRSGVMSNYVTVEEGCRNLLRESNCRFNNIHTIQKCSEDLETSVWDIEDALWMVLSYFYYDCYLVIFLSCKDS
jgi:hypothetical protein